MSAPSRTPTVALLSVAIACFSLGTAMYQGYVQTRNLETVQRDIARREQIRACKDVIEAFFEAKLRTGLLLQGGDDGSDGARQSAELAAVAVSRLGAVGTFLANMEGKDARARYTQLTRTVEAALSAARGGDAAAHAGAVAEADRLFAGMNMDCVGLASPGA